MNPVRTARAALPVLALLLLSGCGDSDPGLATDPTAEAPSTSPAQEPDQETDLGTGQDSGGFGPTDYSYTLTLACFCPDSGVPIRVTVVDDEVVEAVYARSGGRGGAVAGADVPLARVLTIDEVIEAADDPDAYRVEVDWPEGQDYPSSVAVDLSEQMVDEEIGYRLRAVEVADTPR